jgi:putative transposase
MNRRKPEQIVQLLHKVDGELAKGKAIEEICRDEQISPATYYRWKQKYSGLSIQDAKRLKALEVENTRLKQMLAEAMLASDALKEFLAKKA